MYGSCFPYGMMTIPRAVTHANDKNVLHRVASVAVERDVQWSKENDQLQSACIVLRIIFKDNPAIVIILMV